MEGETKRSELQSLLDAINGTEVLESRVALINQLGDSIHHETSDLVLLFECLITYWVDSTCSNISQCMLNKTILHIATRYMELDTSSCLTQLVILGTKASVWCRKHLQMATVPIEESQDEKHLKLFLQLILDTLSFSCTCMAALTSSLILGETVVMLIVENFVLELLHLTKASILETKKIPSIASEVLKVAQVVLDAATKLCRAYFQAIGSDSSELNINRSAGLTDDKGVDYASYIIRIIICTIENLYELGIFAASGGGSLVTVLNVCWKGVVSLLKLGKGVLTEKIDIGDIIRSLVSLAIESLRCAAEAWSSTLMETLSISEAKRTYLPIKFYLINAVRISSEYPCEAKSVHREITRCVLLISSLGISLSKVSHLRDASEALAEFLEPTSHILLQTLLNSIDGTPESKIHILDWLFACEMNTESSCSEDDIDRPTRTSLNSIFYVNYDAVLRSEELMLGRVILSLNLLKNSSVLREEMVIEICRKLDYLLNSLTHEYIYSFILGSWIPVPEIPGEISGVTWQPMFSFILHVLKTFMIVASFSSQAWTEIEIFLLQNLLHPHFLCMEIVRELWCFFIRHAEREMIIHTVDKMFLLLKALASSEQILMPLCPLRKIARSICILLTTADSATVDQVYNFITCEEKSHLSSIIYTALIIEGFPLDSLSENLRTLAARKIICAFYGYIDNSSKELGIVKSSGSFGASLLGLPVHALSSALISGQIKKSDVIGDNNFSQFKKFILSVIHGYMSANDSMKDHYLKLLGAMLDIISETKHLRGSEELGEVILELQILCLTSSADSGALLYQCKPSLASFLSGLCDMEIAEDECNALFSAIWSLYHVLLRERHWAIIHLAIAAFGYFAARTSCTQLWRFVPHDAALSFDTSTGNEANEDRFMSELKCFLEKDVALCDISPSEEQISLLVKEGMALKKLSKVTNTIPIVYRVASKVLSTRQNTYGSESLEMNNENYTYKKKRKFQYGISEGMELLQKGLKTMSNALAQSDSMELKKAFSTHISCLEVVISHLTGLSDSCD